jgi:hypothetical protein
MARDRAPPVTATRPTVLSCRGSSATALPAQPSFSRVLAGPQMMQNLGS